jgi:hypothetical protein
VRVQLNAFTVSLAVHCALLVALFASTRSPRQPVQAAAPATRIIEIEWGASLPAHAGGPGRGVDAQLEDDLELSADSRRLEFPKFTFDLEPIAARAKALFPFLTESLALEPAMQAMRTARGSSLVSPLPRAARPGDLPPLEATDAAIQALVDRVWTRRERWDRFAAIAALTRRYDADAGQLPAVVRRYVDQNVLQPYVESGTRDPRLWTMLGLAAEHKDFITFITRYAAEHPSSRTTIELMFLLDDLVQGSRDTLLVLFQLDPATHLWWTGAINRDAQRLVSGLQRYYSEPLRASGLQLEEAVRVHHDSVRLAILDAILAATPGGYREADAHFLIGSIHWRQRNADAALAAWRQMVVRPADRFGAAASEMLAVITPATAKTVDARAIDLVLARQRARWTEFWYVRLRQFGYRADSY